MDINTFLVSADILKPFFYQFAEYGFNTCGLNEAEIFSNARKIGIDAEKAMYYATNGVNTHKGMIFSGGLICVAVGRLLALGEQISIDNMCNTVVLTVKGLCEKDYSVKKDDNQMTNGERIYARHGIKGSRGEAESGFETVRKHSYPFMKKCFDMGMSKNEALVRTLLKIMSVVQDTNVIKRGGIGFSDYVREKAAILLDADLKTIEEFDRELIENNLSPGGSADLLAVTWFIYNIEQTFG
jgi:triphosphoribosyl-dephospho-CoA synthase